MLYRRLKYNELFKVDKEELYQARKLISDTNISGWEAKTILVVDAEDGRITSSGVRSHVKKQGLMHFMQRLKLFKETAECQALLPWVETPKNTENMKLAYNLWHKSDKMQRKHLLDQQE